jgi:radical SAM superfamily enzyme YgiQ (UPF0313 family)
VKPSKYGADGSVERFRLGFMPNSTLLHMRSLTPTALQGSAIEVRAYDEYVETDLGYLESLKAERGRRLLVALVGVQSHQIHRALDLAAFAREHGADGAVIGGPHAMTCDTSALHGRGVSFALGEAETLWPRILADALCGGLRPVYGEGERWQAELASPVLAPPTRRDLARYVVPMVGVYPARGCPYSCNFCSVIKIAGRTVRSQPVATTIASLENAKGAGARLVMFTSDNFNKYENAVPLLEAMVEAGIRLPFFVQCDTQIAHDEALVALLARAGCFQIFVGVESFSRRTLLEARKGHNHPELYREIVALSVRHGITTHFSNILGFPTEGEADVRAQVESLLDLEPDLASFYILTPIPGTEQYDDFLAKGLITETNLDRFDGSRLVWRHPSLGPEALARLLFLSQTRFYASRHVAKRIARRLRGPRDFRLGACLHAILGHAGLSRVGSFRRTHPMAGGVLRRILDRDSDYLPLREKVFGLREVGLPRSLELSEADAEINRKARLPRRADGAVA